MVCQVALAVQVAMCTAACSSPFGVVVGGMARCKSGKVDLQPDEVKLAYSQGRWAAQVTARIHGVQAAQDAPRLQSRSA
jgi:hypothetical protein